MERHANFYLMTLDWIVEISSNYEGGDLTVSTKYTNMKRKNMKDKRTSELNMLQ